MATIRIPTPLRQYAGGNAVITIEGTTVGAGLQDLTKKHPDLQNHLYEEGGKLRSFVNIYLNQEDIRYLDGEETLLQPHDALLIVPSIAGGK